MPLSKTLRRMVEAHDQRTRDPLGLDAKLQEHFLKEDPFKFNKVTKALVMELMRGEDPNRRDPSIFHASSAHDCRRLQVAQIRYHDLDYLPKRVSTLDGEQRMGEGRWSHIKWQAIFMQLGLLKRAEFFVYYKPWRAGGSPDGTLVLPWYGKSEILLEVKSMSRYRWEQAVLRLKAPEVAHQFQTHMYMQALEIDEAVYLYENRDTQDWHIFHQKRDVQIVRQLRRRYKYMNEHLKEGVLPKPDCTYQLSDKMYLYCPIRDWCKARYKAGDKNDNAANQDR